MRTKETNRFKMLYLIYVLVLVIALFALFFYVRGVMVEYENNAADKYIIQMISKSAGSKTELSAYLNENCFAEGLPGNPNDRKNRFEDAAENSELTLASKKTNADTGITNYEIYADNKPFLTVGMKEAKTYTKLGILTMSEWDIEYAFMRNSGSELKSVSLNENGKYACSVSYAEGFTLLVDGEEYDDADAVVSEHPDFVYIAPYADAPNQLTCFFELAFEPVFTAENNAGAIIEADKALNSSFVIPADFGSSEEAEKLIESLNPLERAKLWSKFMTNDVGGKNYGFETVVDECGLYEGTNLYTLARNWSKNVDIRFVSVHTITGWENESVSNCIKYNDNLYSCDVYAEKKMHLKTGAVRTDAFDNRMYFTRIDGSWYLIDMLSLAE